MCVKTLQLPEVELWFQGSITCNVYGKNPLILIGDKTRQECHERKLSLIALTRNKLTAFLIANTFSTVLMNSYTVFVYVECQDSCCCA